MFTDAVKKLKTGMCDFTTHHVFKKFKKWRLLPVKNWEMPLKGISAADACESFTDSINFKFTRDMI